MEFTRSDKIGESAWGAQLSLTERVGNLYVSHREEIFRFVAAQGVPPAMAQDITQEVFAKLLATLRAGHKVRSELAWLYRVAANRATDYWRRERRWITVELDADNNLSEVFESSDLPADQQAAQRQRMRRLVSEIRLLPKEQRMCLLLRSQGLRYREISSILGVAVSTAADWLDAAVERLRRAIV
jgi:RNA polymerase sigma-70 factor (ECF subfamily)